MGKKEPVIIKVIWIMKYVICVAAALVKDPGFLNVGAAANNLKF